MRGRVFTFPRPTTILDLLDWLPSSHGRDGTELLVGFAFVSWWCTTSISGPTGRVVLRSSCLNVLQIATVYESTASVGPIQRFTSQRCLSHWQVLHSLAARASLLGLKHVPARS
ncbi:hypothetical protein OG21DRAFT_166253 [Imleria badia]|nr:hypothetical protein OG21DRAFT_166253 [Imleria badia]